MIEIKTVLKKKTELLCKGLYLDEKLIDFYKSQCIEISFGRKGGAGPLGGQYFLLEDNQALVNVALWNDKKRTNLILKGKKNDNLEVFGERDNVSFGELQLINNPNFYKLKTSEGILMKKIALVHGIDCLATTIYQKCKYLACGEACKFCGIELSLEHETTILEKTYQQISEVIEAAKKEGRCKH